MIYTIKNEYLTAEISSFGGELRSLIDKDGINRMHTASKDTWNRVSPLLFPQISKMPNLEYKVDGITYKMTAHGFIRDYELDLEELTESSISFTYRQNEHTLKMYPYEFNYRIVYKVIENNLEVSIYVNNPSSDKTLRFMLGTHPAFKVPLFDNEDFTDYSVLFKKKETAKKMLLVNGYLSDQYEDYLNDCDIIHLTRDLFNDDALIFRYLRSSYADVISRNHDKKIRFHFADFDYLAIWSKPIDGINLVSLEAWQGIQKNFVIDHEQMGVEEVLPLQTALFTYKIEVI